VTGILYFNQKKQEFEFRQGPIMAQVVLADEINRATPARRVHCWRRCRSGR